MKTLTSVADLGLVPFPVWCEGHACPDIDDRQPAMEDANAALLAWYRHLVAERFELASTIFLRVSKPMRICGAIEVRTLSRTRVAPWSAPGGLIRQQRSPTRSCCIGHPHSGGGTVSTCPPAVLPLPPAARATSL